MTGSTTKHPFEGMVADYINGHLNSVDMHLMDEALATDEILRSLLKFEQDLQQSLRNPALNRVDERAPVPEFSSIAHRIERPSWVSTWSGLWWGIPATAVLLIAVFVALPQSYQKTEEYETLSSADEVYTQPVLRIIGMAELDSESLEALVLDYGLTVVKHHTTTQAVDALVPEQLDIAQLQSRLSNDQRIRFVKRMDSY